MTLKKSLLISAVLHLIALIFIPGYRPSVTDAEWVEVSLVRFPDVRERIPDWVSGEEVPESSLDMTPAERIDMPVEAEDRFAGVPVTEARPDIEEELFPRTEPSREREPHPRRRPGRREREGPIPEEGEDEEFTLTGPVARRDVLRRVYPEYPRWAQERGIEGSLKLRFWVSPAGMVERVELESTSGYPEMDSRAIEAMKKWIFEPDDSEEMQWGTITIKYTLR